VISYPSVAYVAGLNQPGDSTTRAAIAVSDDRIVGIGTITRLRQIVRRRALRTESAR